MNNLIDLEKKINSELGTKINSTKIKHNQIYAEIDKEDLIDVTLFLKTNKNTKFKQTHKETFSMNKIPNLLIKQHTHNI